MMSGSERRPVIPALTRMLRVGGGTKGHRDALELLREPVCLFKVSAQLSGMNPEKAEAAHKLTHLAAHRAQAYF